MNAKIQTLKGEMHELFTRLQASLGDVRAWVEKGDALIEGSVPESYRRVEGRHWSVEECSCFDSIRGRQSLTKVKAPGPKKYLEERNARDLENFI